MKRHAPVLLLLFVFGMLAVLPSAAYAASRDDARPGIPIGLGLRSGVVDYYTDPQDIYAVELFDGLPVTINIVNTSTNYVELHVLSASGDQLASSVTEGDTFVFTPATSGVYYLEVEPYFGLSLGTGVAYNLTVSGNADKPSNATTWKVSVPSGYPTHPSYGGTTKLRGLLAPAFASALPLPWVVGSSEVSTDALNWTPLVTNASMDSGTLFVTTPKLTSRAYFRFKWAGDGIYLASTSSAVAITPKSYVRTPIAPTTMRHTRYYTVYGYLKPRHAAGTFPVRIYKYRKVSGHWKSYGYVTAKAYNYSWYTKYSKSLRLGSAGSWRVRAYAPADSGHSATWSSGYDYITVK